MSDILEKILSTKREEIMQRKQKLSLSDQKRLGESQDEPRDFVNALKSAAINSRAGVIAEIKKASPSQGIIRENFDPVSIAKSYEQHGAACLSVLTDSQYFQGSDDFISLVKAHVGLPVLRKDFTIDPYQVYEARAIGADCILLIVAALDTKMLRELFELARSLKLGVLVEVHNRAELQEALELDLTLVGINNRNLKTFETSLETTTELLEHIPQSITVVTESGIRNKSDVSLMQKNQVNCFLVGETFMRSEIPGEALSDLFYS